MADRQLRVLQPTASRADLLLQCQWPFAQEIPNETPGEEAIFGTAVHKLVATRLTGKLDLPASGSTVLMDIQERADRIMAVLKPWLAGLNPWKIKWRAFKVEQSAAVNIDDGIRVVCDPPDEETHHYDVGPRDHAGTADLLAEGTKGGKRYLLILDHKTGREIPPVLESGQLASLGSIFAAPPFQFEYLVIGFVHAPEDGGVTIYAERVSPEELTRSHLPKLREAYNRIGDGSLRPGEWCKFCPARMICPTTTTSLVALKAAPGPLTSNRIGAIHEAIQTYDGLKKKIQPMLRQWVEDHPNDPPMRPDGKILQLEEHSFSSLSQSSILAALGPIKGPKEITRLKRLGCLKEGTRMELWARSDKGK